MALVITVVVPGRLMPAMVTEMIDAHAHEPQQHQPLRRLNAKPCSPIGSTSSTTKL